MATVGNLFVNVGASTRGLETGLKNAQNKVESFASKATSSLSGMRLQIPGLGGMGVDLGAISDRIKSITGSFSGFTAITKAAAEQQGKLTAAIKASEAASQSLAGAKGARKNIGEARAMLAKSGIDPNTAATALKTVDTSAMRDKITATTKAATDARLALTAAEKAGVTSGAEQHAAALAKAQNAVAASTARVKDLQVGLAAAESAGAASGAEQRAAALAKAQNALAASTARVKESQVGLAAAEKAGAASGAEQHAAAVAKAQNALAASAARVKESQAGLAAAQSAGAASGAEQKAAALAKAQNTVAASAARLKESQVALAAATKSASGLNGGYYATLMNDGQATRMAASANKQLEKSRRDVAKATQAHSAAEEVLKGVQNSAPVVAGTAAIEAAKKRLIETTKAQKASEEALNKIQNSAPSIGGAKAIEAAKKRLIETTKAQKASEEVLKGVQNSAPVIAGVNAIEAAKKRLVDATMAQQSSEEALKAIQSAAPVLVGVKAIEGAKKRLVDATLAQKKAEEALGAARVSNQAKEEMRSKLNAKGIDLSKGQGALKLQDLSPFQQAAAAAKAEVVSLEGSLAKSGSGMAKFAAYAGAAVTPVLAVAAALGAALAAAMAFTMGQAKQMDALQDAAVAAGTNVETMQRLSATYNELGAASGASEMASQKLAMKLEEAVQGSTEALQSFQRLGLDLEAIASSTPDEALQKTIGAISALGSQREKMLALRDVFGKSGVGLAAVVNASAKSFKEASDRAAKIVIPASIVSTLAAANDKVESTFKAFDKLQAVLAAKMAPTLEKMADALFNFMTTDTASLESGFDGIAAVVSVIYEVCVAIVDVIRIAWNAACFLIEGAMAMIAGICYGVLKLVQAIAYGFEAVSGSTHEASASIGEMADVALELTKQLAIAAGTDLSDVGSAMGMDMADAAKSVEKATAAAQQAADKNAVTIRIAADQASLKKVNDELQSMRDKVANLRFGEDSQQLDRISKGSKGDPIKMKEAEGLQQTLKTLQATDDVKKQIAETTQKIREAYNQSASVTAKQLALEKGVDPVLAEQLATLIEQDELQQRINAKNQAGVDLVRNLQSEVDAVGMSERDVLKLKMFQQGIGDDLVKQALELQDILDNAKIDSSLKDHFTALNESLLKATGNERALVENQLKNIGLTGDALQNAVDQTMDINAKIDEANKTTANTETITSTIEDLANQLDALKLGDAGVLEKKLRSAGAGDTEVAKALAMQAEIAALNESKTAGTDKGQKDIQGVVDSIDTAFGSFKIGGGRSGEMVQEDILSESAKQTNLLASIANNTGSMSPTGATDTLMASGSTSSTLPISPGMARQTDETSVLLKESNTYLKAIATNTAAFAGVLT